MIHNPQQLVKELFALKKQYALLFWNLFYIVTHHLNWWLYYLKRSLRSKYGLHTYNITSELLCSPILIANPFVYIYVK